MRPVFREPVNKFPGPVQRVMREKDIDATCMPVQFDDDVWETAFFCRVAGPESKPDRRILKKTKVTPVVLGAELMAHARASVVVLRFEVQTVPDDPLVFEILLTPGEFEMHYECLKLLARQRRVRYFFADADYRVLQGQSQEIDADRHASFETLAREAFAHDSLVRMAGNYDAHAAMSEVVAHYDLRRGASPGADELTH